MGNIQDLLKKRRLELGLTLEEVADAVGVGKSTVRKWEVGLIQNMRRDNIQKLAEALQLSPLDLLEFQEDESIISIYGDHNKNLEYFSDKPELLELYKNIHESQNLQLLFDTAKDLTPQDLEMVLMIIKGIRKERGID